MFLKHVPFILFLVHNSAFYVVFQYIRKIIRKLTQTERAKADAAMEEN